MPTITRPTSDHETPAWHQRTPENQKACLRIVREMAKERDTRCYISFSLKGVKPDRRGRYPKAVWPIIFPNREAAQIYMDIMPIFANAAGRLKSASIERVRVKRVRRR